MPVNIKQLSFSFLFLVFYMQAYFSMLPQQWIGLTHPSYKTHNASPAWSHTQYFVLLTPTSRRTCRIRDRQQVRSCGRLSLWWRGRRPWAPPCPGWICHRVVGLGSWLGGVGRGSDRHRSCGPVCGRNEQCKKKIAKSYVFIYIWRYIFFKHSFSLEIQIFCTRLFPNHMHHYNKCTPIV